MQRRRMRGAPAAVRPVCVPGQEQHNWARERQLFHPARRRQQQEEQEACQKRVQHILPPVGWRRRARDDGPAAAGRLRLGLRAQTRARAGARTVAEADGHIPAACVGGAPPQAQPLSAWGTSCRRSRSRANAGRGWAACCRRGRTCRDPQAPRRGGGPGRRWQTLPQRECRESAATAAAQRLRPTRGTPRRRGTSPR